jgi:hypothetical protein
MKMHKSITQDRIIDLVRRYHESCDNSGLCVYCGYEVDGCEPDARQYTCDECGKDGVYGAEELLFHIGV